MRFKSYQAQVENKCIHFSGVSDRTCKAGIRYKRFSIKALPCFKDEANGAGCDKCHFPTAEETQTIVTEHEASMKKILAAMAVVPEIKKTYKGKNWQGTRRCPACGGVLRLSHSAYNGHVWGKCETPDCVCWME